MRRFQIGDKVELVKPFSCRGDDADIDEGFDRKIRDSGNRGEITSYWDIEGYGIQWEGQGYLVCEEDVVDLILPPVTDDELAEALNSIQQAIKE